MQVVQIMTKSVECCAASDSLEHAAYLMWDKDCGCVPVCASDDECRRPIGVITGIPSSCDGSTILRPIQ
jgi:predicted transcriptional regulator